MGHRANNSLRPFIDVHVLHPNGLRSAIPEPAQSFQLMCESVLQLRECSRSNCERPVAARVPSHPRCDIHDGRVIARHLQCQCRFNLVPRLNGFACDALTTLIQRVMAGGPLQSARRRVLSDLCPFDVARKERTHSAKAEIRIAVKSIAELVYFATRNSPIRSKPCI